MFHNYKAPDLKQQYQSYFTAKVQPEVVNIGQANYVSILGEGSPGTSIFYKKKKAIKEVVTALEDKHAGTNSAFVNNIVEIFYWFDEETVGYVDIGRFYTTVDLNLLHYRIAIRIPDYITNDEIKLVSSRIRHTEFSEHFELFSYEAGTSVQLLHQGPFAGELKTLPVLQRFATKHGYKRSGMHHEIHLTNFEPGESQAHLQTILRDPVTKQL